MKSESRVIPKYTIKRITTDLYKPNSYNVFILESGEKIELNPTDAFLHTFECLFSTVKKAFKAYATFIKENRKQYHRVINQPSDELNHHDKTFLNNYFKNEVSLVWLLEEIKSLDKKAYESLLSDVEEAHSEAVDASTGVVFNLGDHVNGNLDTDIDPEVK